MNIWKILSGILLLAWLGASSIAETDVDLARENAELKVRVSRLEQELAELRKRLPWRHSRTSRQSPPSRS